MSFAYPEAFFLFIVLALFIGVAVYNYGKKKALLKGFISPTAYKRLGVRSGAEIDFFKAGLLTLAMIFFILALAGPQWGEKFENVEIKGLEMIFLLDTSNSMMAEDLKPYRLEVAKQLMTSIVDHLQTDYLALINFAAKAYVQCPMTLDYEAFKLLADASSISPAEEQGTDYSQAFQLALKSLENSPSDKKLIILITDGEDQEGLWQPFITEIKKQKIIVFTVGIGAASGAPIPLKDKDGNITGWKKDKQGNVVKTQLEENTLIRIASQTGGQYFRLADASGIDAFVDNLKTFDRNVLRKKVNLQKIKRFHYPLFIGILLLLLEFFLSERKLIWKEN